MNKLLLLLSFFVIVSCATEKKILHNDNIQNTVDFDSHKKIVDPKINENAQDTYGPKFLKGSDSKLNKKQKKVEKTPVIAIDLIPALYSSLAYIGLFRRLEQKKIQPNIINASGFSLIIATLYAKYKSSNKLEWKLFKLLGSLKNVQVHSDKWYDIIEGYLLKEFKKTRIEQLKILVTTPTAKSRLRLEGSVVDTILSSLKLNSSSSFMSTPAYFYKKDLMNLGVDLYFLINPLPERLRLKNPNGFVWGTYTKLSGVYSQVSEDVLKLKNDNTFIDILPNLSNLLTKSHNNSKLIVEKIEKKRDRWINKNN